MSLANYWYWAASSPYLYASSWALMDFDMQIFIDESGSFTGFHDQSISVVGALAIPDGKLEFLTKKFAKIRARLPLDNGEVKGRLLNEEQVDEVAILLARNETLFEVTALDLGMHNESKVKAYKEKHGKEMLAKVVDFHESQRAEVQTASQEILRTSVPLYLQALTTFEVLHHLIGHMTMFFSQRRPQELGKITWIVDGKDPQKVTNWEKWWSHYAQGALATMSKRRPAPRFVAGDYSSYDKSYGTTGDDGEKGTDLKLLLKDIRFSAINEPGLEFVDILTNAIRRTLTGNLQHQGWQNIHKIMVHRNEGRYIQFILFGDDKDVVQRAPYAKVVHDSFSAGGKSMLTARNALLV
jgi:hypothetical protein